MNVWMKIVVEQRGIDDDVAEGEAGRRWTKCNL